MLLSPSMASSQGGADGEDVTCLIAPQSAGLPASVINSKAVGSVCNFIKES